MIGGDRKRAGAIDKVALVKISFAVYTLDVQSIQSPIQRIDKGTRCQNVGLPPAAIT